MSKYLVCIIHQNLPFIEKLMNKVLVCLNLTMKLFLECFRVIYLKFMWFADFIRLRVLLKI